MYDHMKVEFKLLLYLYRTLKNDLLLAEEQIKEKKKELIQLQTDTEKKVNLMQIELKAAGNKAKEHESDKHIVSDAFPPLFSVFVTLSLPTLSFWPPLFSYCLTLLGMFLVSLNIITTCKSKRSVLEFLWLCR